jgi:hypothetical protein
MKYYRSPTYALIFFVAIRLSGAAVQSSELNTDQQTSLHCKPILGLVEYAPSFNQGTGSKTVSWPTNWPQLNAAKPLDGRNGFSLVMPGKYLSEFERLFKKTGTAASISGKTFVVSYSITVPFQD